MQIKAVKICQEKFKLLNRKEYKHIGMDLLYLNDIFSMVRLAAEVRGEVVADGPEGFVFDGLGVDRVESVDGLFDLAGDAGDEGVGRDDGVFFDEGAGGDDGAAADFGTGKDGSVHADEDVVLDGAGVDNGAVADGYETADDARAVCFDMQAGRVLYIGVVADFDVADIAAHDGCGPDARIFADFDVTEHDGLWREKSFFVNAGAFALKVMIMQRVHDGFPSLISFRLQFVFIIAWTDGGRKRGCAFFLAYLA